MRYRETNVFANATKPVSCSAAHTAYTFKTLLLHTGGGATIDGHAVQARARRRCQRAFSRFIGGTDAARALTRLSPTYFATPSIDSGGPQWIRCDVVALQRPRRLADLPRKLAGYLDQPHPSNEYGVCSDGDPGTPSSTLVMCSEKHTYHAVAALRLGGTGLGGTGLGGTGLGGTGLGGTNRSPPGASQIAAGRNSCQATVAALLGTSGGFTFVFTYPNRTEWRLGQHFGLCWTAT